MIEPDEVAPSIAHTIKFQNLATTTGRIDSSTIRCGPSFCCATRNRKRPDVRKNRALSHCQRAPASALGVWKYRARQGQPFCTPCGKVNVRNEKAPAPGLGQAFRPSGAVTDGPRRALGACTGGRGCARLGPALVYESFLRIDRSAGSEYQHRGHKPSPVTTSGIICNLQNWTVSSSIDLKHDRRRQHCCNLSSLQRPRIGECVCRWGTASWRLKRGMREQDATITNSTVVSCRKSAGEVLASSRQDIAAQLRACYTTP